MSNSPTNTLNVVTVFYRFKPSADFQAFSFLVKSLLQQGVKVHCISSGELRLEPHPNLVLYRTRAWGRRALFDKFLFEITSPIYAMRAIRVSGAKVLVSTKCARSIALALVTLLSRKTLVTYCEITPWTVRLLVRKTALRRFFGLILDALGLAASNKIICADQTVKDEILSQFSFLSKKVSALKPATSFVDDQLRLSAEANQLEKGWEIWKLGKAKRRSELAQKYQIPEEWSLVAVPAELVGRKSLEDLLRAIALFEEANIAVILCGYNKHSEFVQGISVGLGIQDQVIHVENAEEIFDTLAGADLLINPSPNTGGSRYLAAALGVGVSILAVDSLENREFLSDERLLYTSGNVQELANNIRAVIEGKNKLEELRSISTSRAKALANKSWAAQFLEATE